MGHTPTRQIRADVTEDVDDGRLVELARDGDLEAFGELVRRHQDFVFGAALRVVKNHVVAEDLAQDTFVRAYRALGQFRGEAHVRSWLYRIASNLALNHVQRNREIATETPPESVTADGPARQVVLSEMRAELEAAIERMPDDLKHPLVMREYGGLSYQEIADELGLPLNTVRTRILRARRSLQADMEAWR